jgi:hypothetical protein
VRRSPETVGSTRAQGHRTKESRVLKKKKKKKKKKDEPNWQRSRFKDLWSRKGSKTHYQAKEWTFGQKAGAEREERSVPAGRAANWGAGKGDDSSGAGWSR